MQKILNVHIAEVKVAKKGEILQAILGSCIGIGIIWKEKNMCGLAHCLLSKDPNTNFTIGARYVSQAFPSLLALMKIRNEDFKNIELIIVGGGNMTHPRNSKEEDLVGDINFKFAINEAKKIGLSINYKDVGGEHGRKIVINSNDNTFTVEIIPKISNSVA